MDSQAQGEAELISPPSPKGASMENQNSEKSRNLREVSDASAALPRSATLQGIPTRDVNRIKEFFFSRPSGAKIVSGRRILKQGA